MSSVGSEGLTGRKPVVNYPHNMKTDTKTGHPLRKYCRSLARRLWHESFGAKIIWRNSRHPGSDCSFRIFTGRCAA